MPGQQSEGSTRRAKVDKEAQAAAELRRRRTQQLEAIQAAAGRLEDAVSSVREKSEQCEAFANHLSGFYEEVDKLAKGKALLEATDLIVEHANNIVRDGKALIEGDAYLDRIKEFVPAGNNPVYPDVLLTARAVQQAVGRFQSQLVRKNDDLTLRSQEAKTIVCALRFFLGDDNHIATQADVATMIDDPVEAWFTGSYSDKRFNFVRLDNRDMGEYLIAGLTISDDH